MNYDTTTDCPFCDTKCVFTWEVVSKSWDHDGYEVLVNVDICGCADHSEPLQDALMEASVRDTLLGDWSEAAYDIAQRLGVPASDPQVIKEVTAWLSNE